MQNLKRISLLLPEYLLIVAVVFYWLSASVVLNPVAIALGIILILQIIFKNRIVGTIIPVVLIMACLYMLLALASEVSEFPSFNYEAARLLFVGLAFFLSTMLVSGIMLYKYNRS
ncbi:MAG: hypothetical protein N4A71_21245 [Carboxylicivirga sp.]|jgi:hypothetical protein|nr:hypothetical protein [Carboxylicivirga sp.]